MFMHLDADMETIEMGEVRVVMRETDDDCKVAILARFPSSIDAEEWMAPLFAAEETMSVH